MNITVYFRRERRQRPPPAEIRRGARRMDWQQRERACLWRLKIRAHGRNRR